MAKAAKKRGPGNPNIRPPSRPDVPEEVTTAQLAEIIGVSTRRVQVLYNESVCALQKADRTGYWRLHKSVQAYIAYKDKIAREANKSTKSDEIEEERLRKLRIENQVTERSLIEIEEAEVALTAIVGPVVSEMLTIAPQATDDPALRRKITAEVERVANSLEKRFEEIAKDLQAGRDPFEDSTEGASL